MDLDTGNHIPMTARRGGLTGSARYCSINAHHGGDQGRRDDMESAGYVIVYLAKGRLPWQGIKASNKMQRYEMICEIKMRTKTKELCQGLPKEFGQYMDYVKVLEFDERPDYELLRQLFLEVQIDQHYIHVLPP